jgi:hypothetical protein
MGSGFSGFSVASAAIDYDAFWMLNALVNQYKWHCVDLYNRVGPKNSGSLHYKPILWSVDHLVKTVDDEVLVALRKFLQPFPGISAFQGRFLGTFFAYKGQKGGGNILRGIEGVAMATVLRSFSSINALWNEFRWYLLELRRLHGDPEVADIEHTYVSRAAVMPFGKLLRGTSITQPIDDPVIHGLENRPTLKHFIDEVYSVNQQKSQKSQKSQKLFKK